jgi:hypothetical protein
MDVGELGEIVRNDYDDEISQKITMLSETEEEGCWPAWPPLFDPGGTGNA